MEKSIKMDNAKGWNTISKSYQKRYNIQPNKYYWGPLCPKSLDKLLGNLKGKRILELGSGAAQNSIYLAKHGACVTALDVSSEQLNYGRKLAKANNVHIEFVQGNFESVKKYFEPNIFDKIVSSFALQYCMTPKSLKSVINQIFNLLKIKGELIFSIDHPVRHHGYWDQNDNFIIDNYFDRNTKSWEYSFPEDGISSTMTGSYKTIADYISSIIETGFILKAFIEPEPIDHEISNNFAVKSRYIDDPKKNPFSINHLKRIPGTLIIKVVKE
ncbi:hypothetical protein A2982_04110 [candidate division WWE3 bacterium RIFCSPLOWO2_01_FULL_39_13]|uniref:Methyltransferase domain-containing protein n=1 Tax=candidate division WWE3 bacterium RIFCSPLOWO2_01_FULL_39_13 TaxID=1802624 RepID=A0A1F4V219_UNCKA|nr:MAG: hypothetical protein A2982_04110 [candidate division WWE3 bacterium RIFCSPLOWO2_01_FULL_39_13]